MLFGEELGATLTKSLPWPTTAYITLIQSSLKKLKRMSDCVNHVKLLNCQELKG